MSLFDFTQIPYACLAKKGALLSLTLNITTAHRIFRLKVFKGNAHFVQKVIFEPLMDF